MNDIHEKDKQTIKNLNGKYIKLLLTRLELNVTITSEMRKIILDVLNDYGREINEVLDI